MPHSFIRAYILILGLFFVTACSSKHYTLNLMPVPAVYTNAKESPLTDLSSLDTFPYQGILYVTNRASQKATDSPTTYYGHTRSTVLKLGLGTIKSKTEFASREEQQKITYLPKRQKLPIYVSKVTEFGALSSTVDDFSAPEKPYQIGDTSGEETFARLINEKLKISKDKSVTIYTNGYKVNFDKALLTSAGLWHFSGYDGVLIAFSWPSTPSLSAYFADLETASNSAYHLRLLLKFLREKTDAEHINILGYSAGGRIVVEALAPLMYQYVPYNSPDELKKKLRLGYITLVSSDYDRLTFAYLIKEGFLDIMQSLTIYGSKTDSALSLSQWFLGGERLGLFSASNKEKIKELTRFLSRDTLHLIDVTGAQYSSRGNGHGYFRSSPWVSSDLLLIHLGLSPLERGLVREKDSPLWYFPEDYITRLHRSLIQKGILIPYDEPLAELKRNIRQPHF